MLVPSLNQVLVFSVLAIALALLQAPSGPVLDVGCGNASLTHILAQRTGRQFVGIDVATAALQSAATYSATNCLLVAADCRATPFRDGQFAAIVAIDTLTSRTAPSPAELRRVLSPDGHLVMTSWFPREGNGQERAAWFSAFTGYFTTISHRVLDAGLMKQKEVYRRLLQDLDQVERVHGPAFVDLMLAEAEATFARGSGQLRALVHSTVV